MKQFSSLFEGALSVPKTLYHITPTENVNSILEGGLQRNSRRSTCGTETQNKIYLTSILEHIEDPFPHNYNWIMKDMSVLEVNCSGLIESLEIDPEYEKGDFFMCSSDIPKSNIKSLGKYKFKHTNLGVVGNKLIGEDE